MSNMPVRIRGQYPGDIEVFLADLDVTPYIRSFKLYASSNERLILELEVFAEIDADVQSEVSGTILGTEIDEVTQERVTKRIDPEKLARKIAERKLGP